MWELVVYMYEQQSLVLQTVSTNPDFFWGNVELEVDLNLHKSA